MLDAVIAALSLVRAPAVANEYELHMLIAAAFADAGIPTIHEAQLAPRCRIDFLCGDIGIEVKQGKQQRGRLCAQAERYLMQSQLSALVLVTTRGVNLPGSIGEKKLVVFGLNRLWGVALP